MTESLARVISLIEEFDNFEAITHHDQLVIDLPPGFFRYHEANQIPDKRWDPIGVKLTYKRRTLDFSILLSDTSLTPELRVEKREAGPSNELTEYNVVGDIRLTIGDAKEVIVFLQRYFRCFDFNINR